MKKVEQQEMIMNIKKLDIKESSLLQNMLLVVGLNYLQFNKDHGIIYLEFK